jgi:hypothetical protein
VIAVKDVDHASTSRFARGPETFVVIKIEDVTRVRTKSTRNDKWLDEGHDIDVDKANEIEVTVYDKPAEHPLPIGMLWIRISDLVEELRRKKIEQEHSGSGWVSADKMASGPRSADGPAPPAPFGGPPAMQLNQGGRVVAQNPATQPSSPNVDAWFALEPVGQIHLSMNFSRCSLYSISMSNAYCLQSSTTATSVPWISVLGVKAPFALARKRCMRCTVTSLSNSSSTTSCVARCAGSF